MTMKAKEKTVIICINASTVAVAQLNLHSLHAHHDFLKQDFFSDSESLLIFQQHYYESNISHLNLELLTGYGQGNFVSRATNVICVIALRCMDNEHRCPQRTSCTLVIIEIALLCIPTLKKRTKHSQSKVRQTLQRCCKSF